MDAPLRAHTFNEVSYYLRAAPCPACGKGPREVAEAPADASAGRAIEVAVACESCGRRETLGVQYDHEVSEDGAAGEAINPTDAPSRIVDLHQWLSLFYALLESAWAEQATPAVRRNGFQAALCLAEALKFYGDNELPPPSAFFTPAHQAAFREHSEKFARQKLRDMQAKLPALPSMARRIDRDERRGRRRWWWPFGKR